MSNLFLRTISIYSACLLTLLTVHIPQLLSQNPSDPPGMIVIRPQNKQGSTNIIPANAAIIHEAKDRPGFLVVLPKGTSTYQPANTSLSANSREPLPNHLGSLTIIRPKPQEDASAVTNGKDSPFKPNSTGKNSVNKNLLPPPPSQVNVKATAQDNKPREVPDASQGKLTYETWDAVFVKNMHIGYVHTTIRELEQDKVKYLYGTKEFRQTVSRFGQRVEMVEEETTFETTEGQILVYRRKQGIGRNQVLAVTGTVEGKNINLKGEGQAAGMNESVPWPDDVIGIAKEATLMKDRQLKPNESFSYKMFAGQVNWVAKYTVTMKASEKMSIYQGEQPKEYQKVEVVMEPIRDKQGAVFSLPASTVWHEASTGYAVKAEFDMPPLGGMMTVTRTTKEAATRVPGTVPELFDVQSIKLNIAVDNIHQLNSVTYRIGVPKDADPQSLFARDGRQTLENADATGKNYDLIAKNGSPKSDNVKAPTEEYLKECLGTSFYIDWNNPETKQHATLSVAQLPANASVLDKAKAVESYVRRTMKATEFSQAMAPCNTVAKALSGDCTEYSMLACGICRSLNIPARTNLGLVYAPDRSGVPYLAFHMWFEVYAEGQWVALDGTLAMGKIGPGHIKISDANWHNETSMTPLLPVLRVLMARPTVEVSKTVK
jgi:hypothetical protein